uniref:SXP/RAL-2 family protein Ani s 5-like cation-binding domain-containing protein n=1 Tax=Trichuris muris TaxID=70415 RepID=A0A5S6Q9C4_TRIMR
MGTFPATCAFYLAVFIVSAKGANIGAGGGIDLPFLQRIPGLQNLISDPTIGRGIQTGFNTQPGNRGFGVSGGRNILGLFGTQRGIGGGADGQGGYSGGVGNNWSVMRGLVSGGRGVGGHFDPAKGTFGISSNTGVAPFFGTNRGINFDFGDLLRNGG